MSDLNIVIVDDDQHDYEFLSYILDKFNFTFKKIWLKDGEELLKYLEKIEIHEAQAPMKNVFFLDVNLPKFSGLELVKKIKTHPNAKDSFVIMLSGSKTKSDMESAIENGCDCYLVKPFGDQEIKEFREFIYSKLSSLI
jgi:DNA-binding response OmpR family regulator